MNNRAEYAALMKNRAGMYRFFAGLFVGELSAAQIEAIRTGSFPAGGNSDQAQGFRRMQDALKDSACTVHELAADYAKIFLAAGAYQGNGAFPYESVYTSARHLIMQEAWEAVRSIYAESGLFLEIGSSGLMEDHISVELEYMALLCERAGEKTNPEAVRQQSSFLESHIFNWVPDFLADVEKYARGDFYRGLAQAAKGFLSLDKEFLKEPAAEEGKAARSFAVSEHEMDEVLRRLKTTYKIMAPCRSGRTGSKGREIIRFGEISSVREIIADRQTDFSAKEIYNPVMQTMFFFEGSDTRENVVQEERETLIIAHPCDINAIRRLDTIYLQNGAPDAIYERRRRRIRFILLECGEGFENCTCVSMGSNKADDYAAALRVEKGRCLAEVRDDGLLDAFAGCAEAEYTPSFVEDNPVTVHIPDIRSREDVKLVHSLPFWKEYDDKCIGCAGCNTVCPTCSCFDTVDVIYDETSPDGERRRVWSGCMLDTFTETAGGGRSRKTPGENMRFKTMHKMYDYRVRFKVDENMCVGCGRCVARCPRDIDFRDTVNRLAAELDKAREEQ